MENPDANFIVLLAQKSKTAGFAAFAATVLAIKPPILPRSLLNESSSLFKKQNVVHICSKYAGVSLNPNPDPDCRVIITESKRSSSSSLYGSTGPSPWLFDPVGDPGLCGPVGDACFPDPDDADAADDPPPPPPTLANPFGSFFKIKSPSEGSFQPNECSIGLLSSSKISSSFAVLNMTAHSFKLMSPMLNFSAKSSTNANPRT